MEGFRKFTALYEKPRLNKIADAIMKGSKEDKMKAAASIQAFWNAPVELSPMIKSGELQKASIQAFTTSSDIPEFVTQSFDVFAQLANWDNRYEAAFKVRSFDDGRGYFTIVDVNNYFTFDELPEGAQVPIRRMTGTFATVPAKTYADGLGWTYEMLEDRRFSEMIDIAEQMRNGFYSKKADVHYRLLVTAAQSQGVITYQGSGTSPAEVLKRDVDTIQLAATTIAKDCKDLGFGDVASAPVIIYGSPALEGRIAAALSQRQATGIAPSILAGRNISFQPTYKLASSAGVAIADTQFLMVLPQNKIQRGDKVAPTTYMDEDVLSFSKIQTVRARFGAAVAEPKQVRLFNLA
jgi:hypothetical protein